MKKNVASQSIGCQMVNASTGAAFTGSVTVYITGDNGTQAIGSVGSGVCTHEGNGYHSYAPSQAETNYDHVAFTFIGTGAIPATIQVYTTFPQTGDNFARIGAAGAGLTALGDTRIANLDAAVSTRLASAGYTAPDNTTIGTINTKIGTPTDTDLATDIANLAADLAVVDAYFSAARGEPGQGAPGASISVLLKIDHMFKGYRNKWEATDSEMRLYNDAGDTVDQKAAISDTGTLTTRGEIATGP